MPIVCTLYSVERSVRAPFVSILLSFFSSSSFVFVFVFVGFVFCCFFFFFLLCFSLKL